MEPTHVTLGERLVPLRIRRLKTAKRITLRLSAGQDGLVMTLPPRTKLDMAMAFLLSKSGWALSHLNKYGKVALVDQAVFPYQGMDCRIVRQDGRVVARLEDGCLIVGGAAEFTNRRVTDFLKKQLHDLCREQAARDAAGLGKTVREVKIRDLSSRWGSCSRDGRLTFNWRLILAPPEILDYLIAHEVAHLAEMNHGPRFWACVERLCPDYKGSRLWLRRHGHELHRYGVQ